MAEILEQHSVEKTRTNLAYFWSGVAALMLSYIIIRWGDRVEILTLIIGLIGGTIIGGIFGVYFGGALNKKVEPSSNVSITTDKTDVDATQSSN